MCGIYGIVSLEGAPPPRDRLPFMARALRHRGPDASGEVCAGAGQLGATRLRVVDRRPEADQPFTAPNAQAVLVLNGEIYNAGEIRTRHSGYPYRSRGDAECAMPLLLESGPGGVQQLDGMFALALWEPARRRLVLARDRAGEKPLFYARQNGFVVFASEMGALLEYGISRALDPAGVGQYTRLGFAIEPRTLIAAIRTVPAGAWVSFEPSGTTTTTYWHTDDEVGGDPNPDRMRRLISGAVRRQVRADTDVGVFLSGGIDSAILATLAARELGSDLTAFSVGFTDRRFDERHPARRLARHVGIPWVDVVCDHAALRGALDDLLHVGEPLSDPAALPTLILARTARQRVTVVLSGEGGDELFGGYPTYVGHRFAPRYMALPGPIRRAVTGIVGALPASTGRVPMRYMVSRFTAGAGRPWQERHLDWAGTGLPEGILRPEWGWYATHDQPTSDGDVVGMAMRLDYRLALRHRLLVKLDRATMLASLEARAPFLDPALTRAALSVAGGHHVRGRVTKRVLRRVARPWVPPFILRRRKRGLSVPIAAWLAHGLTGEIDRVLAPGRLRTQGIFDPAVVSTLVARHRDGREDHSRGLWPLFTMQLWMERWGVTT